MKTEITYISEDGTRFKDKNKCLEYEKIEILRTGIMKEVDEYTDLEDLIESFICYLCKHYTFAKK